MAKRSRKRVEAGRRGRGTKPGRTAARRRSTGTKGKGSGSKG